MVKPQVRMNTRLPCSLARHQSQNRHDSQCLQPHPLLIQNPTRGQNALAVRLVQRVREATALVSLRRNVGRLAPERLSLEPIHAGHFDQTLEPVSPSAVIMMTEHPWVASASADEQCLDLQTVVIVEHLEGMIESLQVSGAPRSHHLTTEPAGRFECGSSVFRFQGNRERALRPVPVNR